MDILLIVLVLLLVFGGVGGYWTARPGWSGPNVSGLLYVICVVAVVVLVIRLIGAL
jgi:hypothetical protein